MTAAVQECRRTLVDVMEAAELLMTRGKRGSIIGCLFCLLPCWSVSVIQIRSKSPTSAWYSSYFFKNYPPNISNKLCNKHKFQHSWFINNALQRGLQINSSMKQKQQTEIGKNQNRIRNITPAQKSLKIHETTERRTQTQTLQLIQNPYSWIPQNIFYKRKKRVLYLKTHDTSYIQPLPLFFAFTNIWEHKSCRKSPEDSCTACRYAHLCARRTAPLRHTAVFTTM